MTRALSRHRPAKRTKIVTGALGLAVAVGALTVIATSGRPGEAGADPADKSFFLDITKVPRGANVGRNQDRGARGTFTVDCGRNESGHFNPDNFIAQPGVRNGAQHLHDYVGNLSTNADSTNESLAKAGTTCKNGDKSTYYWPVVRIDTGDNNETAAPQGQNLAADRAAAAKDAAQPHIDCPDVASALPEVPDAALDQVNTELDAMDAQVDQADQQVAQGQGPPAVLDQVKGRRSASLGKISDEMAAHGAKTGDTTALTTCAVQDQQGAGLDNGGANSDPSQGESPAQQQQKQDNGAAAALPGVNGRNEVAGNDGDIQRVVSAKLSFGSGGARKVVAMPRFLRVLYGDAKEGANGPANARASWTCTGFEDRLTDHYPICPQGSDVERIHAFPNCWDGKDIDSANHRTHIVFPEAGGTCKAGFKAVPQLKITLVYKIPHDVQVKGQYKVDSFPEEKHNPRSDHDDFANVMSQSQMNRVVSCINTGKRCQN
ncbi:DUF1996 domain-containing protein [Amycolatopsis saalfeldensis]|uniref:DUF1996 domain-containing protein n=1 Tax=Amycolatopsis saalfeldensis TaxID=394193 RepID=A0A1H8X6A6_9PSEU|nr:DUF1996 domain-containing protein [Amycolatopsis saalfeldensis]SEP35243.1 protein of unknown function [Amycolatopsis saalfeldensis]